MPVMQEDAMTMSSSLTLPALEQIMDKLDDPRKKRLEELLQQARGDGTAASTASGSTARPSSIPSPRVRVLQLNVE